MHPDDDQPAASSRASSAVFDDDFAPSLHDFRMGDDAATTPVYPHENAGSLSIAPNHQSPVRSPPRNSIAKNRADLVLNPDRRSRASLYRTHTLRTASSQYAPSQPSLSRSTSYAAHTDRPRSSAMGNDGPSHPYALYSQSGVRPSLAISTHSSFTPSSLRPPNGIYDPAVPPAHPYGLYPQSFSPDSEHSPSPAPTTNQIGFPGRRVDIRGEEHSTQWVDGHAEQLPAYSRYPDENEKDYAAISNSPASPSFSHRSDEDLVVNSQPIAGSSSTTDPERYPSPTDPLPSTPVAEKSSRKRRSTKVCGSRIPLWWLLIVVGLLVVIGGILGGVLGGIAAKDRER